MSESKIEQMYEQMRSYIRLAVEAEVAKQKPETRAAPEPKVIEGPAGKDGLAGKDGIDGKDGKDGKDGTNGIATREELQAEIEKRVAEINVRTFADIYREVFKRGESYKRGEFVTWNGAMWMAASETRSLPGEDATWILTVKAGRDRASNDRR